MVIPQRSVAERNSEIDTLRPEPGVAEREARLRSACSQTVSLIAGHAARIDGAIDHLSWTGHAAENDNVVADANPRPGRHVVVEIQRALRRDGEAFVVVVVEMY